MEKNKSLQALVAGSEPERPGPILFMGYLSSSCPERRQNPLPKVLFPCRDERERAIFVLVGSLVFFLIGEEIQRKAFLHLFLHHLSKNIFDFSGF